MKRIRNDERGMFFRHDIASGYISEWSQAQKLLPSRKSIVRTAG